MSEKQSSYRSGLLQLGVVGALVAGLGISHCFHRSDGHSDDSPEAGDTDTDPDSPEAGREPTSLNLLGRLRNGTAAMSAETREIRDGTHLLFKAVMNLATVPDLSYKPFNDGIGHAQEEPGPEEPDSAGPGI